MNELLLLTKTCINSLGLWLGIQRQPMISMLYRHLTESWSLCSNFGSVTYFRKYEEDTQLWMFQTTTTKQKNGSGLFNGLNYIQTHIHLYFWDEDGFQSQIQLIREKCHEKILVSILRTRGQSSYADVTYFSIPSLSTSLMLYFKC